MSGGARHQTERPTVPAAPAAPWELHETQYYIAETKGQFPDNKRQWAWRFAYRPSVRGDGSRL